MISRMMLTFAPRGRTLTLLGALVLSGLAGAGCLRAPKQTYPVDQIQQIESLEEIMRVQAQAMDPLFRKRSQTTFSPDELTQFGAAAQRLQATAATLRQKFAAKYKPSFVTYADALGQSAADLATAATAADPARTAAALGAIRDTCRGCHRDNR